MKANEYEAYTRILDRSYIDVSKSPRVPDPETRRYWLDAWPGQRQAESFVFSLKNGTQDGSWQIRQFQVEEPSCGPVAPLDIHEIRDPDESLFYVAPNSRERIGAVHRVPTMVPVTLSRAQLKQMQHQHGEKWWDRLCEMVTHLSLEQVLALGGYRVILPYNEIGREVLPPISN